MPTVSEIMTPEPALATMDMPSETCLMRMLDQGIRHMPVVDAAGKLVGLLTDHALHITHAVLAAESAYVPVEGCPAEASLHQAIALLAQTPHDAIVVVDTDDHPVGVLTEHDIVRLAPALLEGSEQTVLRPQRDLVVIGPDASWKEAFDLMAEHGFRHLPVVGNGPVLGVVSLRDLLGAGVTRKIDGQIQQMLGGGPVHLVHEGTLLVEVAAKMAEHTIGCLPVLDEQNLPVGILTRADLLAFLLATQGDPSGGEWSDA